MASICSFTVAGHERRARTRIGIVRAESRIRTLHRGEHLHRVGDPIRNLHTVRSGVLKCYRLNEDGEEQVLGFHMNGDTCGFDGLAGRTATCNVMALDSTSLEPLPIARLTETNTLQLEMLQEMSRELQRLVRMLQLERCTAEQRVASFLLEHAAYERRRGCVENDFVLPVPRRDLARYLHLATETVSRVFSRLQEAGLLSISRNHVVLHDMHELRMRAESRGAGGELSQLRA